jgi:hypothetical protein
MLSSDVLVGGAGHDVMIATADNATADFRQVPPDQLPRCYLGGYTKACTTT